MNDNSRLIADALYKTDPDLAGSFATLEAYANEIGEQGARVALYRDYERGEHRSGITDQMKAMLRLGEDGTGLNSFNDNYCSIVLDKMVSRIHVGEMSLPEDKGDAAKAWVSDTLERNDWDALQGMLFRCTIRDGDSFVMVDPRTLMWSVEPAYDGFSGVVAIFDGISKTPAWACKIWSEAIEGTGLEADDTVSAPMRLIVYQPNRISYWLAVENGTEVRPDDRVQLDDIPIISGGGDQPEASGVPRLTNELSWPLGKVPIVHFANKYDAVSFMGESEIRTAIPLQDVLNRTIHSMVMASEFSAFRIKWSIGMEIDADGITPGAIVNLTLKDENGRVVSDITEAMAKFLDAVKVGEFEATDMSQYINQVVMVVKEISQNTQTPIYGITVEGALSGEALKQLEIGLIGKVERFQHENTDSVRELLVLTSQIQNAFDTAVDGDAPQFMKVSISWKSAEILDVTSRIAALVKMRADAPGLFPDSWYRKRIGGLLGMSSADIEEVDANAQAENQNALEQLVSSTSLAAV